jgi:uncharacterized protein (DUF1800 family)/sugar lactone lactonase YvrE
MFRGHVALLIPFLCLALASGNAQVLTFGSVPVGTAAPVQTLTYTFSSATTLSAVNVVTTGASGLDYTDGGSTCTVGNPYNAGDTCTIAVAFTPSAPGMRSGAVIWFAQGSTAFMTLYVNGIGQSGAVTIDPGTQSKIATLSNGGQGYGSVIDGAGNVYVVDHANSQVIELGAGTSGTFTQRTVVSSGLSSPTAVALDGAGNLYISDTGNSRVVVVPNEQGTLNSADMKSLSISGLGSPRGIATDGSGNLYVADATNGDVIEIPPGVGGTPVTVASGLASPQGVAVDAVGNVYVSTNNSVTEYQPPFTGAPVAIGSGYNSPSGVAVDASGAVYVADTGNSQIVRVAPGGAAQANIVTGISSPQGVAVDAAANVYVTSQPSSVIEVNRTKAAALVFGNTYVGSTSAPQTLTVSDAGNQSLTVSNPAITPSFTQMPSGGADCNAGTKLSSAGQCLIAIASAPTIGGPLTGTLTLPDNALNNPASTQTVQLSGAGLLQVAQTITFPTIPTQTYGVAPLALNATASSGLPVSYAVSSGPASLSGNTLTITGAGSVTVQASQAGNTQYAPAPPFPQTFTVNPAATTVAWSNPAAITYGTALSATQLDATATPVSAGTYTYAPAAGTVLNVGSQTLSVQFTPTSTNYASSTGSATLQVKQASQTIKFTQKAPASAAYNSSFTVAATATSGLAVSFTTTGVCTNVGATVTMGTGAGTCNVVASQAGNTNYLAAGKVTESTTATGGTAPTVTFTGAPATGPYQSSFTVVATSNSGVTPTITVSGVCSLSGTTVTITSGTGTCTMTANWAANSNYLAATATQTTTAAKIAPTVTFTGAPATASYESTFTVVATSNSGLNPTYGGTTGVCSISGTTVTMTGSSGTCTTTAKWATNANYLAASLTQTTTVQGLASVITWPTPAAITYPTALSATQLNAKANVAGKFVYSPPAGTVLTGGYQTLSVQFTPTSTNYTPATGSVTLTVVQPLAITSASSATFVSGTPGSFTVLTTGSPTPALSETGSLPAGVTFTDNGNGTGTLQGTPAPGASGSFNISITAQNGLSPNAVQSFTLGLGQVSPMVAARFLEQSSWGPTSATIAQVQQTGLQTYLQQQFSAPVSTYPTPSPTTTSLNSTQQQFFINGVQGQDQLRQRVSFALSEIMVVSATKTGYPADAFSLWMNTLQNDAFGNFYNLLNDVTLSPTMGFYLNMANSSGCKGCRPNENYAREIQQLFTIGLDELNIDGTLQLDQNGNPIPTYTQSTVDGFSQVFTGWSYPPAPGKTAVFNGPLYFSGPMLPYNTYHSQGSKVLLNGTTLSAGGTIESDLQSGLQNIFNHPNVAPFICQQLIQKLVTSNPSPDYVSRIAQVFNNDGTGVSGNLQAVVSAILLDPEARRGDNPAEVLPSDGHLREPLLHMMAALRAVNATTNGVNLNTYASNMLQPPFMSPDVFNFYPPNFGIPGTQLLGPEFNILNASTTIARINFINDLIYKTVGSGTTISISPYVNVAGNVGNLLALVNTNIMHGQMPSDMYNTLFTTLSSSAFTNPTTAARAALYLTLSSSQFQVEH